MHKPIALLSVMLMLYSNSLLAQEIRYVLDPAVADVRVLVYKRGVLQIFGHNHVISSSDTQGEIIHDTKTIQNSRFHIWVGVEGLRVDLENDRRRTGGAFSSPIDDAAAQATRKNLMSPAVLDARRFPAINISGTLQVVDDAFLARMDIEIRGVHRQYNVPVTVDVSSGKLLANGRVSLRQSDFKITPLAVMGGMIAVRDEIDVLFQITAGRVADAHPSPLER